MSAPLPTKISVYRSREETASPRTSTSSRSCSLTGQDSTWASCWVCLRMVCRMPLRPLRLAGCLQSKCSGLLTVLCRPAAQ